MSNTQSIRIKLSKNRHSFASLARDLSEQTGQSFSPEFYSNSVRRWHARSDGVPRGKTMLVLLHVSAALNEPVTPVVKPIFTAAKSAA